MTIVEVRNACEAHDCPNTHFSGAILEIEGHDIETGEPHLGRFQIDLLQLMSLGLRATKLAADVETGYHDMTLDGRTNTLMTKSGTVIEDDDD